MSTKLEEAIAEYRRYRAGDHVRHIELAQREQRIWTLHSEEMGKGFTKEARGERRDWFHNQFVDEFGGKVSDYEVRASIYNAGKWAYELLDDVDRGFLKTSQATHICRTAKRLAREAQIDYDIALQRARELGPRTDGRVRKKSKKDSSRRRKPDEDDSDALIFGGSAGTKSKTFLRRVRALTAAYVDAAFEGVHVDQYHKEKLIADFKDSFDLCIEEFRRNIAKVKANTKDDGIQEVGEVNFDWACEVLGFSYSFGDVINMTAVKKRKNRRALDLHPDRNPDVPGARGEFENVQEAYEILVRYSERNNRRANHAKS